MIVVKLKGGLGNQLFQYAAARALSIKNKHSIFLDTTALKSYGDRHYELDHFNIKASLRRPKKNWFAHLFHNSGENVIYKESSFRYNPELASTSFRSLILDGYFQSELYFKDYRAQILKDFDLNVEVSNTTKFVYKRLSKQPAVSIHYRRGDYLKPENTIHNVCDSHYYNAAIGYLERHIESPVYYIFSDDIAWAKRNFSSRFETHFVEHSDAISAHEDLWLMSQCQHNIIANSSFSWWAAWLNTNSDKIVIAPRKWFASDLYDYSDVVPNDWIKV